MKQSMALALFVLVTPLAAQAPNSSGLAGTYAFQLCRTRCTAEDGALSYHQGKLVLLDSALSTRPFLQQEYANACFEFEAGGGRQDSYAGIQRAGLTHWRRMENAPDQIIVTLYRSPDAGYDASLQAVGRDLRGAGRSWGAGAAEIHAPADSVLALYIGPPDAEWCRRFKRESPPN
jgi:hypothetical protein